MDNLIRPERKIAAQDKLEALKNNMRKALSLLSTTPEGKLVLRYLLHESGYHSALTYETREGVNKDVLLANESKRRLYLALRAYMDTDTVIRIELDKEKEEKK